MADLTSWAVSGPWVAAAYAVTWFTLLGYVLYTNGRIRRAAEWLRSRNEGGAR